MTEPAPYFSRLSTYSGIWQGIYPGKPAYLPQQYPDLTGKTAIVTGANTGIGFEVVKLLYEKNCNVIAVVRTESKGLEAREKILADVKSKGTIGVIGGCDFMDLNTIKSAATKIINVLGDNSLNIIIHNAGLMAPNSDGTSEQGYEAMISSNVLGPQLLQHFLDDAFLKKDGDLKRIVWVSSCTHLMAFREYGINWENPTFKDVPIEKRPDHQTLYGQSKAANILQAKAWATKKADMVTDIGCVSVSCFPGILRTQLTRGWGSLTKRMISWMGYDSVYGAYSELFAALSPKLTTNDQGAYIIPFGQVGEPRTDVKAGLTNGTDLKMWDMVEDMIKPFF